MTNLRTGSEEPAGLERRQRLSILRDEVRGADRLCDIFAACFSPAYAAPDQLQANNHGTRRQPPNYRASGRTRTERKPPSG
ncbi:MAG: hypothetical protein V5B39_21820, partial [Accumulibacter sp.]|uniref:hypothetical protein n=1 Tax=Accumulibacter sp. TaxID=2053492 RepID=UPI002FC3A9D7